jgi:hypothetical protein
MERDQIPNAVDLLERNNVNGLIGRFRDDNTMGALLYWFACMVLTAEDYDRYKWMMIDELYNRPDSLRFIDRCVLVIVNPKAAGLRPAVAKLVRHLYDLISALDESQKTTMRDWFKVANERYEGLSIRSEDLIDPIFVAQRHLWNAISKLQDYDIEGLVAIICNINTMGALVYMFACMALYPLAFDRFRKKLIQMAKNSPDSMRWVEQCGLLVVQPEQSKLPSFIQQSVFHLWSLVLGLYVADKERIIYKLKRTWQRYNGEN